MTSEFDRGFNGFRSRVPTSSLNVNIAVEKEQKRLFSHQKKKVSRDL